MSSAYSTIIRRSSALWFSEAPYSPYPCRPRPHRCSLLWVVHSPQREKQVNCKVQMRGVTLQYWSAIIPEEIMCGESTSSPRQCCERGHKFKKRRGQFSLPERWHLARRHFWQHSQWSTNISSAQKNGAKMLNICWTPPALNLIKDTQLCQTKSYLLSYSTNTSSLPFC